MQETRVPSLGGEDSPGEGNGKPVQYSCLENPMNIGAWWATVQGVAQSRTRLKWLSNNSKQYNSSVHVPSNPIRLRQSPDVCSVVRELEFHDGSIVFWDPRGVTPVLWFTTWVYLVFSYFFLWVDWFSLGQHGQVFFFLEMKKKNMEEITMRMRSKWEKDPGLGAGSSVAPGQCRCHAGCLTHN